MWGGGRRTGPELPGRISLEATVSPTEDPDKVVGAMKNLMEGMPLAEDRGRLVVRMAYEKVGCLTRLRDQLRDRRVRAAARRLLLSKKKGNSTTLMLNRQAAAVGVAALCSSPDQSPLGPIYLTIDSNRLDDVIEWLAAYEAG